MYLMSMSCTSQATLGQQGSSEAAQLTDYVAQATARQQGSRKEKLKLSSNHIGSLLRWQPGAKDVG